MKSHGEIRDTLYDFVMNELDAETSEDVRLHLRSCGECRTSVDELERLIAVLPKEHNRPSDRVDEAHWMELAARIERNLPAGTPARRALPVTLSERLRLFLPSPRPAIAFALAALLVAVTAAILVRPWDPREPLPETVEAAAESLEQTQPSAPDIATHLRRSRNLLVGLSNRPMGSDAATDLSVEREASRRLLADNRRYRSEVLDPQASEVLADLERIMIEVANSRDQAPASDLDLIRRGIRQQNLLFKVRMAEQLSSRGMIVRASGR